MHEKRINTDAIIRAYRKLGIDLQKEIHEDMLIIFGTGKLLADSLFDFEIIGHTAMTNNNSTLK